MAVKQKELDLYDLYRLAKEEKMIGIFGVDSESQRLKAKKELEEFVKPNSFLMSLVSICNEKVNDLMLIMLHIEESDFLFSILLNFKGRNHVFNIHKESIVHWRANAGWENVTKIDLSSPLVSAVIDKWFCGKVEVEHIDASDEKQTYLISWKSENNLNKGKVKRDKIGVKGLLGLAKDEYYVGIMDPDGLIDPDMKEVNLQDLKYFKDSCKLVQSLEELYGKITSIFLYPKEFIGITILTKEGIGELSVYSQGYAQSVNGEEVRINYLTDDYSKYQNGDYKMFIAIEGIKGEEGYIEC